MVYISLALYANDPELPSNIGHPCSKIIALEFYEVLSQIFAPLYKMADLLLSDPTQKINRWKLHTKSKVTQLNCISLKFSKKN